MANTYKPDQSQNPQRGQHTTVSGKPSAAKPQQQKGFNNPQQQRNKRDAE